MSNVNYNDGKWHRWNGGEKPDCIHPKSLVHAYWLDLWMERQGLSSVRPAAEEDGPRLCWSHVTAFRVVKEHREPREFWINIGRERILRDEPDQPHGYIRVREVLE